MKLSFNRATALVVISSAFLLAVTSCKKSSNNGGGTGTMTATVSGTAWSNSFPVVGVYASSGGAGLFELIGLQFKGGDSTSFALDFASPFTLNQAFSSDTAALIVAYTDSKTGNSYTALTGFGTGVLTVSSYDSTGHTIAGTFSGVLYNATTGTDSIVVTNGKFNSTFTVN
jgi:hypothetical protein